MSILEAPVAPSTARADLVAWMAERRVVLLWLAGSRAIVLTAALVMQAFHGPSGFVRSDRPYTHLLGVLGTWDGRWYSAAAAQGYLLVPGRRSDPAFFPLYPLLLRMLHPLGLSFETAGIIV